METNMTPYERNQRIMTLMDELQLISRFESQCGQIPPDGDHVAVGFRARQLRTDEILAELNRLRAGGTE
jgi:hypothetical protein